MSFEQEKAVSRAVWDDMAPGWERQKDFMTSVTGAIAARLVEMAGIPTAGEVLDMAAGTGEVGLTAAKALGDSGRVLITDFAPAMVDVARRRGADLGFTNVDFQTLDAEAMDLPDGSFDVVTCRWGFMLMLDPAAAMREARRVLKPQGRLAFSVWGPPEDNPWVTMWGMVLTQRGYPPQADPFGPGGMFSLSRKEAIESLVKEAGFEDITIEEMPVVWAFDDYSEVWTFARELVGAVARLIADLPGDEVEAIRAEAEAASEAFKTARGYEFPGVTINVSASRP